MKRQEQQVLSKRDFPNTCRRTLRSFLAVLLIANPLQLTRAQSLSPRSSERALEVSSPAIESTSSPLTPDYSNTLREPTVANYLWPLAGNFGFNITMWGLAKSGGAEFANIKPAIWKENFQKGFHWDNNSFKLNQVGHPFHGSMFFTVARANNLSFWQAIPYVMFGSFQWEYFMETERPSTNDWINTTWGGTFLGEILFRLSNRLLDDSTSGSTRFWKELSALTISPMNGVDRLLTGKAWQDGPAGKQYPLTTTLQVGADGIGLSEGTTWGDTFRLRMRFDYGDPYAEKRIRIPFEVFDFAFQFNAGGYILGQSFDGTGVLYGNRIQNERNRHLLAWLMDFEYFTNGPTKILSDDKTGIFRLGETGTGFGWYGRFDLGWGFKIDTRAEALFVPLGAISSPYAVYETDRDYSYALGGATKVEFNLRQERWGRLYAIADRYWYHVLDGALGSEIFGFLKLGAYLNVYQGHGFGGAITYYDRRALYTDYPQLKDAFWTSQLQYEFQY